MKKYIIKNADGSEQTVMRAIHNSRKEAGRELMRYLSYRNDNWDVDNYLSPFDFILEEVEYSEVTEDITDFDGARKALGLESNVDFELLGRFDKFDSIVQLISDINPMHIEALIALNKLFTIAEAWNKKDGFVPDFSDWNQEKWFPWFQYDKDAAGFVYAYTKGTPTFANANLGSRLCFKTPERAEQFGKQFVDLYNKVFL